MTTPDPHTEGYRVTWLEKTANKITLWVAKATPTSVPDDGGPVGNIVCQKNDTHSDRSGVETPQDKTALIYLHSDTFASASNSMQVGTVCSYLSTIIAGYETLTLFGWS